MRIPTLPEIIEPVRRTTEPPPADPASIEQHVRAMLSIPAGDLDFPAGADLVHRDVIMHMDGVTARGLERWYDFVTHVDRLRSRRRLRLVVDEVRCDGHLAHISGHWERGDGDEEYPLRAIFRVVDAKVVELWSTRWNYVCLYGPGVSTLAGFAWMLGRLWLWSAWRRSTRLAGARPFPGARGAGRSTRKGR